MDAVSLVGALAVRATVLQVEGALYAARWFENVWWIWKLKVDSEIYVVNGALTSCTCPVEGDCKHLRALRVHCHRPRRKRPADYRKRGQ